MRRDLLSVSRCQVLDHLAETCIVYVHLCHIYHSRKVIFIAEFPCLLCSHLHAGFSGDHDDRSVRRAHCFFHFSDKIKITRCIQYIDLRFLPLDGDQARADRKSAFLLLFIKIAHRIGL